VTKALASVFAFVLLACGGPEAQAPHSQRPVDERRASQVIAQTFVHAKVDPETNRDITIFGGKPVHLEVAAAGHKFGVAYLTREEQAALGDALPKKAPDSDALIIVPGDEEGVHVLVLFERDYMQDDLMGEAHENTNIAAELKLERDVKDFLRKATEDQWP
jgi:hypothetical protein